MKPFELLAHTADLRLKVNGASLKELFVNAIKGLAYILHHQEKYPTPKRQRGLKVQSADLDSLLVDFLSEALSKSQIHHEVYWDAHILDLSETEVEAELLGDVVEIFDEDIKAITYHGVEIKKEKGYYTVTLVLDI